MDDININEICSHVEEVEVNAEGDEWIKLSWINKQNDDDPTPRSSDIQTDLHSDITQAKDSDNKESCTESEDISDGISVITDSDADAANANFLQICQFNNKAWPLRMLETQVNQHAQGDMKNIIIACVVGIIIGLVFSHPFIVPEASLIPDEFDTESIKTASRNIVDTYKELTEVKTMLNEIKEHISIDKKIMKHFLVQLFKSSDFTNKKNDKLVLDTVETFDSKPYPLDQLQVSLHVLSSLAFIYDNNSSLKNDMSKTLDIVNNTKVFYETLILLNNSQTEQDSYNSAAWKLLQHDKNKIHMTSKLLLSNLAKKMNKIISNVYNKYAKERHKLIEKLCRLRNTLSNDKFLKQLTENNRLFKNYDEYCFSNDTSKELNGKTSKKYDIKTNNIKKMGKVNDTALHKKYNEKNIYKMENNKKSYLKHKKHEKHIDKHIDNSDTKFSQKDDRVCNSSRSFLPTSLVDKIRQLKYQLSKRLHYLKSVLSDNDKFFKEMIEDAEENGKKSITSYIEEDSLQSIVIDKDDILKNSFDNILMDLKDTYPLSIKYCPKFNINLNTFDNILNHATEKDINSNKKHNHDKNNKKIILDHKNSAKIAEEKKLQQEDYSKSDGSAKKVFNNDKINTEGKNVFPQNKIKDHMPEHVIKFKPFSSNSRTIKQDNQRDINTDWQDNNKGSHGNSKQQQSNTSDWYFKRVHSRRNARRNAEHMYQRNINWYLRKRIYKIN